MHNRTCGEGWERGQKAILEYLKGKGAGRPYVVGGQLVYRDQENRQTCSSASPDEMVVKVYPLKYETTDLCASLE